MKRSEKVRRRRPNFVTVVLIVTAALQLLLLPVWVSLFGEIARTFAPTLTFGTLFHALPYLLPLPLALYLGWRIQLGMWDEKKPALVVALVDFPAYIHFSASLLAGILVVAGTPIVFLLRLTHVVDARAWSLYFIGAYAFSLALALYGTLVRRPWFVVEEKDVAVEGWPAALDGLRIAQLSDLHIGSLTSKSLVDRWVEASNSAKADLIVLTGDYVTSGTVFHQEIADIIARLHAPLGVALVMGNHDYFGGGEPLLTLLRKSGARVLQNESEIYEKNGASFLLAGVDDTWTKRANMTAALERQDPSRPTILLAHDPDLFPLAAEAGVAFTLSGHTHGGQIAAPFLARRFSLANISHHFVVGYYRAKKSVLYVHPGLGTTGPPVRFGVAPAIAIHRMRAAR